MRHDQWIQQIHQGHTSNINTVALLTVCLAHRDLDFSFVEINKLCTKIQTLYGYHLAPLYTLVGKFCSKASKKYHHCTQHAKWHYLTHSSCRFFFFSKLWTGILSGGQLTCSSPRKNSAGTDDSPCASAWSRQHSSRDLALGSGMMGWLLSQLHCHLPRCPGGQNKCSPDIRWNWRYQNLLSRVKTVFSHRWRHANTALTKQQISSLTDSIVALPHALPSKGWICFCCWSTCTVSS